MKTLAEKLKKTIEKKLKKNTKVDLMLGKEGIAWVDGYVAALEEMKLYVELYDAERKYWETK
jgi:exosome complex RNA-binding protein Rrp4